MGTPEPGRHHGTDRTPGARPRAVASGAAAAAGARERLDRVRRRAEETAPGRVTRRARELDVVNHAVIMASLSLTLLIPALVTLAAVVPLGADTGLAAGVIRRLGLSGTAAADLRSLFPPRNTVSGSTGLSGVVTVLFAVGWPAELQRGYEAVWSLPSRGLRDIWRPLLWLFSLFAVLVALISTGSVSSLSLGALVTVVVATPVLLAWTWWTQHLLLGGRVSWPELAPGAVTTTVAMLGFSVAMRLYVPGAIVYNHDRYGPIGVVMVLLSWVMGFSVVMLGGPLVGHYIATRHISPRT